MFSKKKTYYATHVLQNNLAVDHLYRVQEMTNNVAVLGHINFYELLKDNSEKGPGDFGSTSRI